MKDCREVKEMLEGNTSLTKTLMENEKRDVVLKSAEYREEEHIAD